MGEGGQIWLKCITGDLIMMIRDKNNIFERVENFHADLAWNYPDVTSRADKKMFHLKHLIISREQVLGISQSHFQRALPPTQSTHSTSLVLITGSHFGTLQYPIELDALFVLVVHQTPFGLSLGFLQKL